MTLCRRRLYRYTQQCRIYTILLALVWSSSAAALANSDQRGVSLGIIGGGLSGVVAALTAARQAQGKKVEIILYEASVQLSSISMPQCDDSTILMEDPTKPTREILHVGYPRDSRELASIFNTICTPIDQYKWWQTRGNTTTKEDEFLDLVTRRDGSVVADVTQVVSVLKKHPLMASISICTDAQVKNATIVPKTDDNLETISGHGGWCLQARDSNTRTLSTVHHHAIILATGPSQQGLQWATRLGHHIVPQRRSLFGFRQAMRQSTEESEKNKEWDLADGLLPRMVEAGDDAVYAPFVRLSLKASNLKTNIVGTTKNRQKSRTFKQSGPIEFICETRDDADNTEAMDGASRLSLAGKAAMQLSSLAAMTLYDCKYRGTLWIHFCPEIGKVEDVYDKLWQHRQTYPKQPLKDGCPLFYTSVDYDTYDFETESFATWTDPCVPLVIWQALCDKIVRKASRRKHKSADVTHTWGSLSPQSVRVLADTLVGCPFAFQGRHVVKSAFVNTGGVSLREMDMRALSSKVVQDETLGSERKVNHSTLFLCGQILDGDGSTTGFHRMRDFATGVAAVRAAVDQLLKL